uniref:Uncharacterized protein n=1 Tax=Arundo donax TaxID=35708 RepID=A0A0A9CV15_ARUDO
MQRCCEVMRHGESATHKHSWIRRSNPLRTAPPSANTGSSRKPRHDGQPSQPPRPPRRCSAPWGWRDIPAPLFGH